MSRNFVQAGRRLAFTPTVAYAAGDLVYWKGFYGVVQDDVAAGALGTLILDGVWDLSNVYGGQHAPGTKFYAAPSVIATSALVYPQSSIPSGANPVGRLVATTPASGASSLARILLFHPNQY